MSIRARFNISCLAIEHSRLTLCFWLTIAVAGIIAFSSLKYSLFPDVTFPVVVVHAQANLETTLDTETQLTIPIEQSLESVPGLTQLYSSTYGGQTIVNLLLDTNIELEDAITTVENNLKELSPSTIKKLDVIPFNLNESSAVSYVLIGENLTTQKLNQIATTKIIPVIEKLPGVQRVDILGNPQSNPQSVTAELPSTTKATLVRFNGKDAISFQVIKQSDANTLEVVKQVEDTLAKLRSQLSDIQLVLAETSADYIRQATKATIEALLGAVLLAILVIYPFLRNFRATAIAAMAIPISLLGTFIIMALAGLNLETLTLLALALVIGIIVDDAIVEVENITRHIEQGNTPRQAALLATREIGLTVSVSTLTIVAVFMPIALMGGTLGQFFRPFGLTISAAVLTSLLVARTLSPVLAVYWLSSQQDKKTVGANGIRPKPENKIVATYRNLLQWSLNHRQQVIGIAIASFIAGVALIPLIPQGFVPQLDRGEFNIVYTTPLPKLANSLDRPTTKATDKTVSSSFGWLKNIARSPESILLRKTMAVGKQIETVVLEHPDVESVYTIGGVRGEPHKGKLYVKLKSDRASTTSQVQSQILLKSRPLWQNLLLSLGQYQVVRLSWRSPWLHW